MTYSCQSKRIAILLKQHCRAFAKQEYAMLLFKMVYKNLINVINAEVAGV